MKEICMKKKCKDCKEQLKCFGCKIHNYILINQDTTTNTYKCSKCGDIIRLNKDNMCCSCINRCKGKVTNIIDKDKGIYKICNKFNKGGKEDEN